MFCSHCLLTISNLLSHFLVISWLLEPLFLEEDDYVNSNIVLVRWVCESSLCVCESHIVLWKRYIWYLKHNAEGQQTRIKSLLVNAIDLMFYLAD